MTEEKKEVSNASPRDAALAVGFTVALGMALCSAPAWLVIAGGAAGSLFVFKLINADS